MIGGTSSRNRGRPPASKTRGCLALSRRASRADACCVLALLALRDKQWHPPLGMGRKEEGLAACFRGCRIPARRDTLGYERSALQAAIRGECRGCIRFFFSSPHHPITPSFLRLILPLLHPTDIRQVVVPIIHELQRFPLGLLLRFLLAGGTSSRDRDHRPIVLVERHPPRQPVPSALRRAQRAFVDSTNARGERMLASRYSPISSAPVLIEPRRRSSESRRETRRSICSKARSSSAESWSAVCSAKEFRSSRRSTRLFRSSTGRPPSRLANRRVS